MEEYIQVIIGNDGKNYEIWMKLIMWNYSSVQLPSCVWRFATPWTAARRASLSITNSRGLLKLMSIESVMPSNHLILCHPLLLTSSIFPSNRVFSNERVLCFRWPASASVVPMNIQGWFPLNWCFALFAVQGPLKSLLECWNLKASICQCSAFFLVQLSHPYITTGKTISLVQLLSQVQCFATPRTAPQQASLSFTNSWILLKLMSIQSVMPSNHLTLCCPLSFCLQSFPN